MSLTIACESSSRRAALRLLDLPVYDPHGGICQECSIFNNSACLGFLSGCSEPSLSSPPPLPPPAPDPPALPEPPPLPGELSLAPLLGAWKSGFSSVVLPPLHRCVTQKKTISIRMTTFSVTGLLRQQPFCPVDDSPDVPRAEMHPLSVSQQDRPSQVQIWRATNARVAWQTHPLVV